jgi:RES domain-containing protein
MLQAWRIVKGKHAATAFSGEGAAKTGGRWNSRGVAIVYTSSTKALAVLESLVHLNPPIFFKYVAFRIEFDASIVERLPVDTLPKQWAVAPAPPSSQGIGDLWVKEGRSAVLAVPSAILSDEPNYLLNPGHPDFRKIEIGSAEPFTFDPRLLV